MNDSGVHCPPLYMRIEGNRVHTQDVLYESKICLIVSDVREGD